jgi:hypothetical protein
VRRIEEYKTFIALKRWDSLKLADFADRTEGFGYIFAILQLKMVVTLSSSVTGSFVFSAG